MRVAYVISTLSRSGPVNVLFGIVESLVADCEIAICTLAPETDDSRIEDFLRLGVSVECFAKGRLESMLHGKKVLARRFVSFKPDIVHVHGFRASILCASMPYPIIATVHNCIYEDYLTTYGCVQARWMTYKEVAALRRCDVVVACSESNGEYLQREYGLELIVIRNGVDQCVYSPLSPDEKLALRQSLGYEDGKTILISTGGCSEWKGTLPLLKAFDAVNRDTGSAELHILGGGSDFETCQNLGYDDVVLHGFVDDVVPYLRASDLFVSASRSEGMPLAVLEALSCGLPALLSDIPPHREIEAACHRDSLVTVADLTDEDRVREALRGFLAQDYPCLTAEERLDVFGSSVMANGYLSLYKELAGGRRS